MIAFGMTPAEQIRAINLLRRWVQWVAAAPLDINGARALEELRTATEEFLETSKTPVPSSQRPS